MTINHYLTTFAGLPVLGAQEQSPADPAAVAWRLEMEDFEAEPAEFEAEFGRLLERAGPAGPTALIIGEWGSAYERAFPMDLLVRRPDRLRRLLADWAKRHGVALG